MLQVRLNIEKIREEFPILSRKVHGRPLVYLDNAATTQKPRQVIGRLVEFYTTLNSNIHRGVHYLSEQSSAAYEEARESVRKFINANNSNEIIFTHGTTESVNITADSFGEAFIREGDEIITTQMEHHSNFLPWQALCLRKNANLKVIPVDGSGGLILEEFENLITDRTKLISLSYISNVTGIINPVKEIIKIAHSRDIPVFIDGAQAVQHKPVDVRELDADFFAFSGHKMYAETGIGVLYGKEALLEAMPPARFGGGMIEYAGPEKSTFLEPPLRFEPGTANYAGAVSLMTAIEYIESIGLEAIEAYEKELYNYAWKRLSEIEGLELHGRKKNACGAISFNLVGGHHYDAGQLLDKLGIAVRTGHHCAQPLMRRFNVPGTIRASFAVYNTREEIDSLIEGISRIKTMLV
ncbi:MAG: aminotransferase class V-fold PLP-dependent enzyme [Candidatus Kapaibacterium sp.]